MRFSNPQFKVTDIHKPEVRKYNMAKVKGKDTKPEILVRSFLHSQGFRFRLHDKSLPGNPDIVLKKYKAIIFINGCFWHSHFNCKAAKLPETRKEFWQQKIQANLSRDEKNIALLLSLGWRVIIVWQCEIKNRKLRATKLAQLIDQIKMLYNI